MNARAGVVTSQVVWFASAPLLATAPTLLISVKGWLAGTAVVLLASFLPDLDHHNSTLGRYMPKWFRRVMGGHRMGMHSVFLMAGLWYLTRWLMGGDTAPILASAVVVGMGTHVVLDMLTKDRVGLLYPLTRRKFGIGIITTGSVLEDQFVVLVKFAGAAFAIWYSILAYPIVTQTAVGWVTSLGG